MTEYTYQPRGRYFEEFGIGDTVVTAGRTITEADVVNFAGVTGDFNQLHVDAEFAAGTLFEQRIAHGLLVQSIAVGLAVQLGFIEGTVLAFRELECKFSKPVFFGDTIHAQLEIEATKAIPRLGGGNIFMAFSVLNQRAEVVQRGRWTMLIKSRPDESGS